MPGVGVLGGYGPAAYDIDEYDSDYPPGPKAWNAGFTFPLRSSRRLYANDLNQQLSQPVSFLAKKPMAQGAQMTSQSVANNTFAPLTLDTQVNDPWYMRSDESDTSQLSVNAYCDGIWLVQGQVPWAASSTSVADEYEADIYLNGALATRGERWMANGSHVTPGVCDLFIANASTEFQLGGYQLWGSTLATFTNATAFPSLTARWIAASGVTLPGGQMPVTTQTLYGANGPVTGPVAGPLLTPPAPGTWTTLQEATSAQLNSDIRNNVLFLSNVPVYKASQGTPQVVPASTATAMTGMAINIDNWSAGSATKWTAPCAGVYLVGGQVGFATPGAGYSGWPNLICDISGTTTTYSGKRAYGEYVAGMALRVLRLSKGDTVQLGAGHSYSSTVTTLAGSNTRLFTVWLSS
jgi:hypothetical protein